MKTIHPTQDPVARYAEALARAELRSSQPDYKGCGVYVNARISIESGIPQIVAYELADWCDGSTVLTFVNGERM